MKLRTKIFLAVSVLLLVLVVAGWCWNESTKTALAEAQARCRAAGLPMTIDDIRPPHVPDADNAALALDRIAPLLKPLADYGDVHSLFSRLAKFKTTHPSYQLDATGTKELADLLEVQPVQDVMALLQEAVPKKRYDARIEYENGIDLRISNYNQWRGAVGLLGWHARLTFSQGRTEDACADIWNMTVLAEFGSNEPAVLPKMIRWAAWRQISDELEQLDGAYTLPAAWNQKFATRLAGLDLSKGFALALDGERIVFGESLFRQLIGGQTSVGSVLDNADPSSPEEWMQRIKALRYHVPGELRLDYADYIDDMHAVRDIVAQESLSFVAMDKKMIAIYQVIPDSQLILNAVFPEIGPAAQSYSNARAKINAAEGGLALERYRLAKGAYPATLADLVPEFLPKEPVDVFTGKPLIYRPEPEGAVVYSVGPNLRDDGGVTDNDADKDDLGWAAGTAAVRKFTPPPEVAPSAEPAKP